MADLRFTEEMLQRIETTLADIEAVLESPSRAMRAAADHDLGDSRLTPAVEEFADRWQYGIDELGRCSVEAVEALHGIRMAFYMAEADLVAELNHDKMGPPKQAVHARTAGTPALGTSNPLPTGPPWPTWPSPGGRSTGP